MKNFTPHAISFFSATDTTSDGRKLWVVTGAKPGQVVQSDRPLTARFKDEEVRPGFYRRKVDSFDPIPKDAKDDDSIVSALYLRAMELVGEDTSRLWTVKDTVYDRTPDGKEIIVGCIGLCQM